MRYLLEALSYCKEPPWRLINYQKSGQNRYFFGDLRNLSSLKYQIMTHDPPARSNWEIISNKAQAPDLRMRPQSTTMYHGRQQG